MNLRFQGIRVFVGPLTKPGDLNKEYNAKTFRLILDEMKEMDGDGSSVMYYNHPFQPTTTLIATGKDKDRLQSKYGYRLYPEWAPMMSPINVNDMENKTIGDKLRRFTAKWVFNSFSALVETQVKSTTKMNAILSELAQKGNKDAEGNPVKTIRFSEVIQ